MTSKEGVEETTVSERGMATIPAALRDRLDIEPGDKIRWTLEDDDELSVEVVHQQYGAFDDDDLQAPMGGDSVATHDIAGHETDPTFVEDQ